METKNQEAKQDFKKALVPEGTYQGEIVGVHARLVGKGQDERAKLVVDIAVRHDAADVTLPLWLVPYVQPSANGRRASRLHTLLASFGLLADFEDAFPAQNQWNDLESATELANFLANKLRHKITLVRTRTTTSRTGEHYSTIDDTMPLHAPSGAGTPTVS